MSEPIPGPPGLPIVGNKYDVDPTDSMKGLLRLHSIYGHIFTLNLGGLERVYVGSQALCNEVYDDKRFQKAVQGNLAETRNGLHDGLFTARNEEHNWGVAHRALMPAFGPISIKGMFDEMHDIASQLVEKWARAGENEKIAVSDDFTKLTLDSIALCAMGKRFNSYYREGQHPFVRAMTGFLVESGRRGSRTTAENFFMRGAKAQYDADIKTMVDIANEVIEERKQNPNDHKDLLNAMLYSKDPKTGEHLTADSVVNNMLTFLIAGHETTSGLLSFLFYHLVKNPRAYQLAQKEIDEVIGTAAVTAEHLEKLPYLNACMRESLRLHPTATGGAREVASDGKEVELLSGGKYMVKKGTPITVLLMAVHRDPAVWGDDAELFKPERMLDEPFNNLPPNSWKPFGTGMRGCIGRPFAWQEALLTSSLLLQNLDFRFADPTYTLAIKQTLTIKPKDLFMCAKLRTGVDAIHLGRRLYSGTRDQGAAPGSDDTSKNTTVAAAAEKANPMTILYGSNSGTCESLARTLAQEAPKHGFNADVKDLDSAIGTIKGKDDSGKERPHIIISSSYEGQPPDNAAHFVEWLSKVEAASFKDVKYAIYGCGHHDWTSTFHKIPKLIDTTFADKGATRIAATGLGDVAVGDVFNEFDKWADEVFWPAADKTFGTTVDHEAEDETLSLSVDVSARPSSLRQELKEGIVLSNELLTHPDEPAKRHLLLQLPTGMSYAVGDYLSVLPVNNRQNIRRVLNYFKLPWDAMITIQGNANTVLPKETPISAFDIVSAYVELSVPATRKNVTKISQCTEDIKEREELQRLAGDAFDTEVAAHRLSALDILEAHPLASIPFAVFLGMLPPMRIRQYSISSSPLAAPHQVGSDEVSLTASITYTVLTSAASTPTGKPFVGVASNYLSQLEAGDHVHLAVKPSHGNFHLPADIEKTPVIMACAGTGLAPFRGFVEERAVQIKNGRKVAPALLFVGCAHSSRDRLFAESFKEWEDAGAVKVKYAFSRDSEKSGGAKHVQDRLWSDREEVRELFASGGRVYVCGSTRVGQGTADVCKKIWMEKTGKSENEAAAWFEGIKAERYASDVFA